jgi:hypothetical protein
VWTDFTNGRVIPADRAALAGMLYPALPAAALRLPDDYAAASWRAIESNGIFTAIGTAPSRAQATLTLDAATLRLSSLVLGSADSGPHAETRVTEIKPATLDRSGLEASLNQALVVGSVDRSDASMQDYVQDQAFFAVRFPRTWRAGGWDAAQRRVSFTNDCGAAAGCPGLTVGIFDLAEHKGAKEYAADLRISLARQPEYRQVTATTETIGDSTVGVVEYLHDRTLKGKIATTHHLEYIFVGKLTRYHLDFSAPDGPFEVNRGSFEAMASLFTYLRAEAAPAR